MEPVVIVGPITDVTLGLARLFMQKGLPVYVVTNSADEWRQVAPEVFSGSNVVTEEMRLTFSPRYTVIVPAALNVPETLYNNSGKVVSVISHQLQHETPSIYQPLLFSSKVEVHPQLPLQQKVEEILRHLFSFGGNTTIFTDIQKIQLPELPKPLEPERVVIPPAQPATEIPSFLRKQDSYIPTQSLAVQKEIKPRSSKRRRLLFIAGLLLGLLLLPFTLLGIATALTLVGLKLVTIGELSLARSAFAASGSVTSMATVMPGTSQSAYMLQRISTTGEQGTHVIEQVNEIMEGVFSAERYPLTDLSQELQQELEIIHRELSFLETELQKDNSFISHYMPLEELQKIRQAALAGADIAGRLPSLLGVEEQKTYMVLLQNNMELRPTGGFIGSFALLNFAGGRLIDAPVYDVYSADGQLKGHVEPPAAIKDYLGEANWYLRDSNWDPDFPTSANRAEWFLDKTLGTPINGVIAIDLEFVRQLIAEQGELHIADFDMKLTKDNFYEVLQNEVHKEFFPGSRKKAAVLTATMNALMSNLLKQVENKDVSLAAVTARALAGRHIQIHLEDPVLQQHIKVLGWAGEAKPTSCGENCEQIWVGLAEANVGVNKANYFVERSAEMDSRWLNGQWEHELTVTLINTARGEGVEEEHNYETYLRVMAAPDAKFDRVLVQTDNGRSSAVPEIEKYMERVEAGALVLVPSGETRVVTFLWSEPADIDFSKEGALELYWRKQAGIEDQPISMTITLPEGSLTEQREFKYNSNLTTDFKTKLPFGTKND